VTDDHSLDFANDGRQVAKDAKSKRSVFHFASFAFFAADFGKAR
jgi:hypothetical protein